MQCASNDSATSFCSSLSDAAQRLPYLQHAHRNLVKPWQQKLKHSCVAAGAAKEQAPAAKDRALVEGTDENAGVMTSAGC